MSKLHYVAMVVLVLLGSQTLAFHFRPVDGATTITVPDDFATIQEAINAALDGDTVFVRSGVYHYKGIPAPYYRSTMILVNKSISLIGEDKFTTILDGKYKYECNPILWIASNNVTVSGFTICHSACTFGPDGGGIYLPDSNGTRIVNNLIIDTQYGVNLRFLGTDNLVAYNIFVITGATYYTGNAVQCFTNDSIIHHNAFIGDCPCDVHGANIWEGDDPLGGNFWGDYKGDDADRDGIGDTPYLIHQNNQDNYPLMRPLWQFDGDINYDGKVELKDVYTVGKAYGSSPTHPTWNLLCDTNHDLRIDLKDYFTVCKAYGKTW